MKKRDLTTLGAKVREKRGKAKLRDTAENIGISAPTLMRIEAGRIPDVQTFGKICQWLQMSPESFLGYTNDVAQTEKPPTQVSTHLKAQKLMKQETLTSLSRMIALALKAQKEASDRIEDGEV